MAGDRPLDRAAPDRLQSLVHGGVLATIVGWVLWGIPGAFLAVPIAVLLSRNGTLSGA